MFLDSPHLAPANGGARGPAKRKPWDYRVAVAIPHLGTPDTLAQCVELLRLQTVRPYIMVVDTGSSAADVAEILKLEQSDLEIHLVRGHGYPHGSDPVCHAMDLAFSLCRSPLLFATHADCFLRRRDLIADLAARCTADNPVVGYEMSPRDLRTDKWKGCVSHTCTMHHMPTMHRLGVTWGIQRATDQFGEPREQGVWPDTETAMNLVLRAAGVVPELIGAEQNGVRHVDANIDHPRSYASTKIYNTRGLAVRAEWMVAAMTEAKARAAAWRAAGAWYGFDEPGVERPIDPAALLTSRYADCTLADAGRCTHPDKPHGARPSPGVCNAFCRVRSPIPGAPDVATRRRTAPPPVVPWAVAAPRLWGDQHRRALRWDGTHPEHEHAWQRAWRAAITCPECLSHWDAWAMEHPVDLSTPDAYFEWSRLAHNDVNRRIGRDEMSAAAARALWETAAQQADDSAETKDCRICGGK